MAIVSTIDTNPYGVPKKKAPQQAPAPGAPINLLTGKPDPAPPASPPPAAAGPAALPGAVRTMVQKTIAQQNAMVPDTYAATLQAIAQARRQRMMQQTNGMSGSMLGIT